MAPLHSGLKVINHINSFSLKGNNILSFVYVSVHDLHVKMYVFLFTLMGDYIIKCV